MRRHNESSRSKDLQDVVKQGVWGEMQYIAGAGASMTVRGTGTLDEEIPLMNFGYGFNLPRNSDADVIMVCPGSDVNKRVGMPCIPRTAQYAWPEGTGGFQHPTDPERRVEFNESGLWLKDGVYSYGDDQPLRIEINGNDVSITSAGGQTVTIAGDNSISVQGAMQLSVNGPLQINAQAFDLNGGPIRHNGINIGDNHVHPGVENGLGITQGPQ